MSSFRGASVIGVGLLAAVLTLSACGGDGQQGIPTETPDPPATTTAAPTTTATPPPTTTTTNRARPPGPPVGEVPGNPDAAAALAPFLQDLASGGIGVVTAKCWTVPPTEIPGMYSGVGQILEAAAAPGADGQYAVTWIGPAATVVVKRSEIASGYACPSVFPAGVSPTESAADAEWAVQRYLGRLTGAPVNRADAPGTYPLVCDNRPIWDPTYSGLPTVPPLFDNPSLLTGSASFDPDSIYVAADDGVYSTVYADVTDTSGVEQNRVFTLTVNAGNYCIGDISQ